MPITERDQIFLQNSHYGLITYRMAYHYLTNDRDQAQGKFLEGYLKRL
jgi:hypothetical protein